MSIDIRQLRIAGITFGVVLGIALTVFSIVSFYIMISTSSVILISAVPFIFSVLLPIILVIILCFNLRKKIGGFWNMRQAATSIFIMFFTAFIIQFILRDQLFAKVIEPQMVQKTETAMTTAVSSFLKQSKASQHDIDKKMEEIKDQFEAQKDFSIGKQIEGIGISIIFMFVLAIVFAAFFKREIPGYNPQANEPLG
jgi:tetrahydromethanopterin S-methyltransferase subunit G